MNAHTGKPIKRLDPKTQRVIVYCPIGHVIATLSIDNANSYYCSPVTCKGA